MTILLDTHVFLWYISADPQLPTRRRDAIRDPGNGVFLSAASVWETVIKHDMGKLELPESPAIYLPRLREQHRIATLPVEESTFVHLANLPRLHRDPFDRIIIAQAIQHEMNLATVDDVVRAYPVSTMPTN